MRGACAAVGVCCWVCGFFLCGFFWAVSCGGCDLRRLAVPVRCGPVCFAGGWLWWAWFPVVGGWFLFCGVVWWVCFLCGWVGWRGWWWGGRWGGGFVVFFGGLRWVPGWRGVAASGLGRGCRVGWWAGARVGWWALVGVLVCRCRCAVCGGACGGFWWWCRFGSWSVRLVCVWGFWGWWLVVVAGAGCARGVVVGVVSLLSLWCGRFVVGLVGVWGAAAGSRGGLCWVRFVLLWVRSRWAFRAHRGVVGCSLGVLLVCSLRAGCGSGRCGAGGCGLPFFGVGVARPGGGWGVGVFRLCAWLRAGLAFVGWVVSRWAVGGRVFLCV